MMRVRNLLFWGVTILMMIAAVELGSWGFLRFSGEWRLDYSDRYRANASPSKPGDGIYEFQAVEFFKLMIHPYFGFLYMPEAANNAGFRSDVDYPYPKKVGEVRIGIFGGSVASIFSDYVRANDSAVQEVFRAKCGLTNGHRVKLLNFAISDGKQPQQFFIASYFLDSADIFVNLDGRNEVATNLYPTYPMEFPSAADHYAGYPTRESEKDEIDSLRARMRSLFARGQLPIFRNSSFYYLVVSRLAKINHERIKALIHEISKGQIAPTVWTPLKARYYPEPITPDEQTRRLIGIWERFTIMQKDLVQLRGKEFYDFLLPNPTAVGGKVLSVEEQEMKRVYVARFREGEYARKVEKLQKLLARAGALNDPSIVSLQYIFQNVKDTVHEDGCCHFNDLGYRLLLEAVAENICRRSRLLRAAL